MEDQYGFIVKQIDNEKAICLNNDVLVSTMEGTNRFGTYVVGDTLYHDGIPLVKATENNDTQYGINGETGEFNGVALNTKAKTCINITIENYNKLLKNIRLDNYKPYDRNEVYNLVDDVDTAELISYTEEEEGYRFGDILWRDKHNVIYNNVVGVNVNVPYEVNFNNNMFNTDRPHVDIRYFDPVLIDDPDNVEVAGQNVIHLNLRVSDYYNSVLNYDTIGPRYKNKAFDLDEENASYIEAGIYRLIIKTEDGDVVERYVYNGTVLIDTPEFKTINGEDRETWFSVQCVDSRGVASIEQFLDVYVRAHEYEENFLEVTDSDLNRYGIDYDGQDGQPSDNILAYNNKLALSELFNDAKQQGYNGVVLPTHDYYIDLHKRIGDSISAPKQFGSSNTVFSFLHFSDVHDCADSIIKCKELMQADNNLKFSIFTGDLTNKISTTYLAGTVHAEFEDFHSEANISSGFNKKLLMIGGNHDYRDFYAGGNLGNVYKSAYKVNAYLRRMMTDESIRWGDPVIDYHTNPANNSPLQWDNLNGNTFTYSSSSDKDRIRSGNWYKDYNIANDSILRVIGIDQYEYGASQFADFSTSDESKYYFKNNYTPVFTQQQIDWFINVIQELGPNDYFIIACHTPPVTNDTNKIQGSTPENTAFWSTNLKNWSSSHTNGGLIPQIVDAYKHNSEDERGIINERIYNLPQDDPATTYVDIDVDFTGVEPATFIGYLCGHIHGDAIDWHPDYPDQLIMCIDTSQAKDQSSQSDIYESQGGIYQAIRPSGTLLNKVSIDFANKIITIQRIGHGSGTDGYLPTINTTGDGVSITRNRIAFPFVKGEDVVQPVANVDLGTQKYYYAQLENGKIKADTVEQITIEDIIFDRKELYRYDDGEICYIGDDRWYNLDNEFGKGTQEYRKDNRLYLKTSDLDNDISYYIQNDINLVTAKLVNSVAKDRALYFVYNTAKPFEFGLTTTVAEYNKDNLVFPDHFTVDMNGSRFIISYTTDIHRGNLVRFWRNVDSHIKNGSFVGLYSRFKGNNLLTDGFLRAHIATGWNIIGEGMGVFSMKESRYCSIDNIEISDSLGYECCIGSSGIGTPRDGRPNFYKVADKTGEVLIDNNHKYIDANGNVVFDESIAMVTSEYLPINSNTKPVVFGRDGNNGYVLCGLKPEVFAFFYRSDYSYIGFVTTKLYASVKVPTNAKYVRYVGYGIATTKSKSTKASDWVTEHDRGIVGMKQPTLSIGCVIKNCYIHDTRTTAITNPQGHQILFDNNTYERCATNKYLGVSSGGGITPLLGDFEDSWQWCKYVAIRNCTAIKNTDKSISNSLTLFVMNCEYFEFSNNIGISLKQGGGVESGVIANNNFSSWTINRTRGCFHPQVEMTDNVVKTVSVVSKNYDDVKMSEYATTVADEEGDTPVVSEDDVIVEYESLEVDTAYNDNIEPVLSFSNSTFKTHIQYDYFKLRKCVSDTVKIDYIN